MTADTRRSGGFVRTLVAISASLSLIGGLAVAGVAARWYSLRHIGVDAPSFVSPPALDGTSRPTGPCSSTPCNYLLLGSDSREGLTPEEQIAFGTDEDIGGENRADTIILVHTEPDQQKAIVPVVPAGPLGRHPRHGREDQLGVRGRDRRRRAARVARTVKQLTGLRIHHFLYVDLAGFQASSTRSAAWTCASPYPIADGADVAPDRPGSSARPGCQRLSTARRRSPTCGRATSPATRSRTSRGSAASSSSCAR